MSTSSVAKAAITGGLLGGLLDLVFAVSFAAANGVGPLRVFETIASGWLGAAAFDGGAGVAAIGVGSHFLLAVIWALAFATLARRVPVLLVHPVVTACAFGIVVFLTMRLVVLPLSAYPRPVTFKPLSTVLDLASHMLLFALPIVLALRRAVRARTPLPAALPTAT